MTTTDWDKPRRVDIGFHGGQNVTVRLTRESYDALRSALEDGGRWHSLTTEDSEVVVDLSQAAFVRLDTEQHRVGF
jgi:hypothetical protein